MNILLIGHNGLLGKAVRKRLDNKSNFKILHRFPSLSFFKERVGGNIVINCAVAKRGLLKSIITNIILPIYLSIFSKRYIHICTDCVYDGRDNSIKTKDSKLTISSVYSFTKIISYQFLKHKKNTLIIRTSFMGRDTPIIKKLISGEDVFGYDNYHWSGVALCDLADFVVKQADTKENGLIHFFGLPTTKYDVLWSLSKKYDFKCPKKRSMDKNIYHICNGDDNLVSKDTITNIIKE